MSKSRRAYAAEFRRQLVELVDAGSYAPGAGTRVRTDGAVDQELGGAK